MKVGGKVESSSQHFQERNIFPISKNSSIDIAFFVYRQQITQLVGAFGSTQQFQQTLDQIDWNSDTVQSLQQAVLTGSQVTFCRTNDSVSEDFQSYVNTRLLM